MQCLCFQVSVTQKSRDMSDDTVALISDSVLVVLQQMRGVDYGDIAKGITPRVTAVTGGDKWSCFIGDLYRYNWDINMGFNSYIECKTSDMRILLFR